MEYQTLEMRVEKQGIIGLRVVWLEYQTLEMRVEKQGIRGLRVVWSIRP